MSKTITIFAVGGLDEASGLKYIPLGAEFVKRGYSVRCLTTHANLKSVKERHVNIQGVDVYFVGQMQVLKKDGRKYYFNPFQLAWVVIGSTLNMIIKGLSFKSDVIYCFKPQPINGFAAAVVKTLKNIPLVIDTDDYEAGFDRLSPLQKKIVSFFEDKLPKLAENVTYNTSFLKNRYVSMGYREEMFVKLTYSPDKDTFLKFSPEAIAQIKTKYNLIDKKIVLYFGTLSLDSGHSIDLLIDSFELVYKKLPHATLLIVGGGEDYDYLQKYVPTKIKKAVHFAGRVAPEEIPNYLQCADLSVDPARDTLNNKGRSPWKIFESLLVGLPVVTCNVGDRREYLRENKAGFAVMPDSPADLAEGIIKILSDEKTQAAMGQAGEQIMQEYTWPILVDQLIDHIPAFQPPKP